MCGDEGDAGFARHLAALEANHQLKDHFHSMIWNNCGTATGSMTSKHKYKSSLPPCPSLLNPWIERLRGLTVAFVGDSMLRGFFIFLLATLHTAARAIGQPFTVSLEQDGGANLNLHPGTPGSAKHPHSSAIVLTLHNTSASEHTSARTVLLWCWFTDPLCQRDRRLHRADRLVVHHGAWHHGHANPPSTESECWSRHDVSALADGSVPVPATLLALMPPDAALLSLVTAANASGRQPIWSGYSAPHFPWGHGEFEDARLYPFESGTRCVRATPNSSAPRAPRASASTSFLGARLANAQQLPPCSYKRCLPLDACISTVTAARVALARPFAAHGARTLPMWDASVDAHDSHIVRGAGPDWGNVDCRHFCNPGVVPFAWSQRLFRLLA